MAIIVAKGLVKRFRDLVAVAGVDLEIEEAECFGLLGPNGAGKTSVIRMLTAVSPSTQGEAWVAGKNVRTHSREIKAILGVVPQLDNLDPDLSVFQNLVTFARYFDIPGDEARRRAQEALKLVQLEEKRNARIEELSGGMKRRLLMARGMINSPRIMVLDEPTIGLDPQAKHLVWQKLRELKAEGTTQILCTQNMDEAELLCDRVAIMHQGRILSLASPAALIAEHAGEEVMEMEVEPGQWNRAIEELNARGLAFQEAGDRVNVFGASTSDPMPDLKPMLRACKRRPATLEDVFFRLTGRSLSE